jgi:phosphate:Na+ symporter
MADLLLSVGGPLAGGLGLFLLGMAMMTDGLKLAAGPALQRVLGWATRTRGHALASGFLVTTVMQSSSAATVAAIGFINAGLLGLQPALWVLFGSNVGSTTTAWIVALVGLKFKIEAFALPLVGLGMALRLTGAGQRRGHLGAALAGFGLLFLGIALMQQAFGALTEQVALPQGRGFLGMLAQLAVGVVMTVLMQSSAASMAIALTAAQGGLIDTQGAAAVVIGANIGTTVTAIMAAIGATPNARRAASAHVVFNLITATVALALLPWLLGVIAWGREALDLPADPAAQLALFHTTFNVLGVLLMWPLADRLTRWLMQRFRQREEDEAQPRYLDDNVLAVPTLALDALQREIARIATRVRRLCSRALDGATAPALAADGQIAARLDEAVERFVERMNRQAMPEGTSARLAQALRVLRYLESAAEQAVAAAGLARLRAGEEGALRTAERDFTRNAHAVLQACAPPAAHGTGHGAPGAAPPTTALRPEGVAADAADDSTPATDRAARQAASTSAASAAADVETGLFDAPAGLVESAAQAAARSVHIEVGLRQAETTYQALKAALLAAGAAGEVPLAAMEEALRRASALRRAVQQVAKAALAAQAETAHGTEAPPGDGDGSLPARRTDPLRPVAAAGGPHKPDPETL